MVSAKLDWDMIWIETFRLIWKDERGCDLFVAMVHITEVVVKRICSVVGSLAAVLAALWERSSNLIYCSRLGFGRTGSRATPVITNYESLPVLLEPDESRCQAIRRDSPAHRCSLWSPLRRCAAGTGRRRVDTLISTSMRWWRSGTLGTTRVPSGPDRNRSSVANTPITISTKPLSGGI